MPDIHVHAPATTEREPLNVIAVSGGKDSTAMALRLQETEPDTPKRFIYTATGDELPPMVKHMERLEKLLGQEIEHLPAPTLDDLIERWNALPNFRQRWCTREIKVQPCLVFLASLDEPAVLCVGLRADEETREGIYSDQITNRFPFREWGWGIDEVWTYLDEHEIEIPERTDCARCFYQRIGEWYRLWQRYPWLYEKAVEQEETLKRTFRTPMKDAWPLRLAEIREAFQLGRKPQEAMKAAAEEGQGVLFGNGRLGVEAYHECRICSL